jgi:RES domain-containing protein
MRLWRISNYTDLSGVGGLRYAARWHSAGRPIVYAAEHPAAALTEILVHVAREDLPDSFQMITIDVDEDASVETIEPESLPNDWLSNVAATRAAGDRWLAEARSLALRVPSALVPDAWNVLLNPAHGENARMRVVKAAHAPLDPRLR